MFSLSLLTYILTSLDFQHWYFMRTQIKHHKFKYTGSVVAQSSFLVWNSPQFTLGITKSIVQYNTLLINCISFTFSRSHLHLNILFLPILLSFTNMNCFHFFQLNEIPISFVTILEVTVENNTEPIPSSTHRGCCSHSFDFTLQEVGP